MSIYNKTAPQQRDNTMTNKWKVRIARGILFTFVALLVIFALFGLGLVGVMTINTPIEAWLPALCVVCVGAALTWLFVWAVKNSNLD